MKYINFTEPLVHYPTPKKFRGGPTNKHKARRKLEGVGKFSKLSQALDSKFLEVYICTLTTKSQRNYALAWSLPPMPKK